jgi:hypothetical protein
METDKLGDRIFADARTKDDFYLALSSVAGDRMGSKTHLCFLYTYLKIFSIISSLLVFY